LIEFVGRFKVEEKIGEGAMADVYRAFDPSIRRSLAIKVLKEQYRQDKEYSSRFLREAKAAGALSHPNIVTIYDVGESDGYPYIAMELLDGEPLNDVMDRIGKLSSEQVLVVAGQLADALRYAHTVGIVHRDIKPSNIMLSADGRSVKILDFGIARVMEGDSDQLKTQIGQVLGTPRYMSPEQALGQQIDGRSDLFSLGVVMYEMITGHKAFAGGSAATLALQITQQEPEPIGKLEPQCPRGLQFIVAKLLAKKPDRRFADGQQLASALRREQLIAETAQADASSHRYLPLQIRVTLVMGLVTALVLAIAVGFVVVRQNDTLRQTAMSSGAAMTSFVATNAALTAADNATLPPDQQDWAPIEAFVQAASLQKDVVGVEVVGPEGIVRGASDPKMLNARYSPPTNDVVVQSRDDVRVSTYDDPKAGATFRFIKPIQYAGRLVGRVDVSVSRKELEAAGALTRNLLIALGVVVSAVVAGATYFGTRLLARPLRQLRQALDDGASGNLNFRISHSRTDEFGELFDAFNRFCASMQERLENVEAIALEQADDVKPPSPAVEKPIAVRRGAARKEGLATSEPPASESPESAPESVQEGDRTMIEIRSGDADV